MNVLTLINRSSLQIICLCWTLAFAHYSDAQFQKGSDMYGSTNNELSGYSLSMPNQNNIAIAAPWNGDTIHGSGRVHVMHWDGVSWVRKGQYLYGLDTNDRAGYSISMPDTNTIAISSPLRDGTYQDVGMVRVYRWNGLKWVQKGNSLVGDTLFQQLGQYIEMPDSNTLAVLSPRNFGNLDRSIQVYSWNGASWIQKGGDLFKSSIWSYGLRTFSMPDANTIAGIDISSGMIPGSSINFYGRILIYKWNGSTWNLHSIPFYNTSSNNSLGGTIVMADTSTLCFSYWINSSNLDSVQVRILRNNGGSWIQKGAMIQGPSWYSDRYAFNLAMPDSNTLAIAAPNHDNPERDAGMVEVYKWQNHSWVKSTANIFGDTLDDNLGHGLAMSDANTLAVGAPWNDGASRNDIGQVKVFRYCDSIYQTYGTDNITACNHYTWIDGIEYDTSNYMATHSLLSGSGCDSIVSLNLQIIPVDTSVTVSKTSLSSNAINAQYQWISCGNKLDSIPGAVGRIFVPDSIGSYAVLVTENNCTDISLCYYMGEVNVVDWKSPTIRVYPNPAKNSVWIECSQIPESIVLYDSFGKVLAKSLNKNVIEFPKSSRGVLILEMKVNGFVYRERILNDPD